MYLSGEVFIESRFARDRQIAEIPGEQAQEMLNRAKALMFAVWKGEGIATSEQVADFYEVTTDVVCDNVRRHRDEFETDGLKTIKGKALTEVSEIISRTSQAVNVTLWMPRAALRLGMLLRDSEVAKQVRNLLVEMAAQGGRSPSTRELELQIELQQLKQRYQDTGWEIVKATSPAMLAFKGFLIVHPLVIPEDVYEECLYLVAKDLYGEHTLREWRYDQQFLPDFLRERGILPGDV